MLFTSVFTIAAVAVTATAGVVPSPLDTREAICGSFYDTYLTDSTAGPVFGTKTCQATKKPGENPNDQSTYTFKIKGACNRCQFWSEEGCTGTASSESQSTGKDWDTTWPRSIAKSFMC